MSGTLPVHLDDSTKQSDNAQAVSGGGQGGGTGELEAATNGNEMNEEELEEEEEQDEEIYGQSSLPSLTN